MTKFLSTYSATALVMVLIDMVWGSGVSGVSAAVGWRVYAHFSAG